MRYLLDTHILLWFLQEPEKLPPGTLAIIEEAGGEAAVSIASLWEIAVKVSLNKLSLPRSYGELFPRSVTDSGLTLLPIEPQHLVAVSQLPFHHRDPFDRLLIAQAQVEELTLISNDPLISQYDVALLRK